MRIYKSYSSRETQKFAEKLARSLFGGGRKGKFSIVAKKATIPLGSAFSEPPFKFLLRKKARKNATVFALEGDLGSGKTTFVQGFLRGLGIRRRSASPTFIIFRKFAIHSRKKIRDPIREENFKNVYHVDAYRIKKPRELLALGIKEILSDPQNIVLVEWAEKIKKILPKNTNWVRFRHRKKENERILCIPVFSNAR